MRHQESAESVEAKLTILLEGLKESANISELCRRHGTSQTTYYKWRDKCFEGGKNALAAEVVPFLDSADNPVTFFAKPCGCSP